MTTTETVAGERADLLQSLAKARYQSVRQCAGLEAGGEGGRT